MVRNGLCFFGTPWHPRWYSKYRGYPAVHFLLVDLDRIDGSRLDFMPAIVEKPVLGDRFPRELKTSPEAKGASEEAADGGEESGPRSGVGKIFHFLNDRVPLLRSRHRIHSSKDTGWRLWHDFGRTGRYPAEILLPVFDFKRDLTKPRHLQTAWGRRIERFFPNRWSFVPAPGTYVTPKRAPGFEPPEFTTLKPECFVWRGAPFAFHLRRHVRDTVATGGVIRDEMTLLNTLFARLVSSPAWFSWGVA
jgi:hypothetical protein